MTVNENVKKEGENRKGGEKDEENEKGENKNKRTKQQTKSKQTIQESDVQIMYRSINISLIYFIYCSL